MLVIDPRDDSISYIPVPAIGSDKFGNIIQGDNGMLYLVPYLHSSFVEYNVYTSRFTSYLDLGLDTYKFLASASASNGSIFAFHNFAADVRTIRPSVQHLFYFDPQEGTVEEGRVVNTPTEFWLPPIRDQKGIVFHSLDSICRLPITASFDTPASMASSVTTGVLVKKNNDDTLAFVNDWETSIVEAGEGGVCGAVSFSQKTDLYCGYSGTTFYIRTGDTRSDITSIFETSVFTDAQVGAFGGLSDYQFLYTTFGTNIVNKRSYNASGDSGSTFSIGRVFGQSYNRKQITVPQISTTLNGYLSEVLVFRSNVTESATRFSSDQIYYFKDTQNLKLRNVE
jgi:hypothetical protein